MVLCLPYRLYTDLFNYRGENTVTILADNNRYWSHWTHSGTDYIEAAKSSPDIYCRFEMADT